MCYVGLMSDEEFTRAIESATTLEELQWFADDLSPDQSAALLECMRAIMLCGPNAARMMLLSAQGHIQGRSYGDWEQPKDWIKETFEELRDAHNYLTAEEARLLQCLASVREARGLSDKAAAVVAIQARAARA